MGINTIKKRKNAFIYNHNINVIYILNIVKISANVKLKLFKINATDNKNTFLKVALN